jgi:hypothetical protein
MYRFRVTLNLNHSQMLPPEEFVTETDSQTEFWARLFNLERELSRKHGGTVTHLFVTSLQDIPHCGIKKGQIVAHNSLALS